MKLMTAEIKKQFAKQAALGITGENAIVYLKLFDPCGRFTAYAIEYEPEHNECFGYVISPLGQDCDEWGYFSLTEIAAVRNRLGLGIERDRWWKPKRIGDVIRSDD